MWKDRAKFTISWTIVVGIYSPLHIGLRRRITHTLDMLVKSKERLHATKLAPLRLSPTVLSGAVHVIYWTCGFISFGELHKDFQQFIRAAVFFHKRKAE